MRHPRSDRISWFRSAVHTAVRAAILAGALGFAAPLAVAQDSPELPRPSPLARVEQQVGVTKLAVEYSSPGVKGRRIFGGLVPYSELWRTGANAVTGPVRDRITGCPQYKVTAVEVTPER